MKYLALPGFVSLLLLAGCTTRAHLSYHPIIPSQEPNHIALNVPTFDDAREYGQYVGALRNGLWMPVVKIHTDDSIPGWMTNAFKTELTNAGYTILDEEDNSHYVLEGKILHAFAHTYFIYHGKMHIQISLKHNSDVIFQKDYVTKKSGGINWMASPAHCMNTLEFNLQEICQQFITDFNQYRLDQAKS
ncbi:MAG: hypothetical protein K9M07_04765 [Simkaniaceae bacterium]|nr:hypothetical protein [Simkaniaceae bacterium]MCF7852534.1 hypothetical protein [Simkaniaceae bacterium]